MKTTLCFYILLLTLYSCNTSTEPELTNETAKDVLLQMQEETKTLEAQIAVDSLTPEQAKEVKVAHEKYVSYNEERLSQSPFKDMSGEQLEAAISELLANYQSSLAQTDYARLEEAMNDAVVSAHYAKPENRAKGKAISKAVKESAKSNADGQP